MPGIACVQGICTTFAAECGQPCAPGKTCFSCSNHVLLFAACTTSCGSSAECHDPALSLCQFGQTGNTSGMFCTASSLGRRCQAVALLNLTAMDSAGTYPATIGTEIDITLESPVPGSYSTTMTLSSAAATILEVTIPAGPPTPNGPTRLYRMRATSSGMAHLQIPFEPSGTGASRPPFGVTINVR